MSVTKVSQDWWIAVRQWVMGAFNAVLGRTCSEREFSLVEVSDLAIDLSVLIEYGRCSWAVFLVLGGPIVSMTLSALFGLHHSETMGWVHPD